MTVNSILQSLPSSYFKDLSYPDRRESSVRDCVIISEIKYSVSFQLQKSALLLNISLHCKKTCKIADQTMKNLSNNSVIEAKFFQVSNFFMNRFHYLIHLELPGVFLGTFWGLDNSIHQEALQIYWHLSATHGGNMLKSKNIL